ncbi:MAG: exonuclease SbcCD subunit D [Gammaproteobacteria bacterium]|nr:exonuclease SbcCD subunit D [Gammaproteobacteria bacterium]
MKFIHTSDWHIGRQFHNVSLLDDQQHVLSQIINAVRSESVDALVIAGDIYDRSVPPASAVKLLDEVLNTVCNELGVPVLLIPGNHDSAQRLGFAARQLKQTGLYIFDDLANVAEAVRIKGASGISVNFYGIPYNDPEQVRHQFDRPVNNHNEAQGFLLDKIKQSYEAEGINVLISHCFVDGAEESESERPLSIGGAERVAYEPLMDFNYVALGHLHGPQYRGDRKIRYSGSILKYSFSEQFQKKAITLVEFNPEGEPTLKSLDLKPLRDMRQIEGSMAEIIETAAADPHADDYIMVRLTDQHAILDAMGKLRAVYPNVLHLEKPGIMSVGLRKSMDFEKLKRSELDMFRDFYSQVSINQLSDSQEQALTEVIEGLHKEGLDI